MKKFFAGIISGIAVSFCVAVFASQTPQVVSEVVAKKIDAYFGRVKLVVNGKNVDKETLVYDDSTYIPLRAAAEVLGVEVEWDEKTGTAILTSPKAGATPTASGAATATTASATSAPSGTGSSKTTTATVTKSNGSTASPTVTGASATTTAASGTPVGTPSGTPAASASGSQTTGAATATSRN